MPKVIDTGCTCERAYDGFICKMHYKAAKGKYYDEVAYHESYERIQGKSKAIDKLLKKNRNNN